MIIRAHHTWTSSIHRYYRLLDSVEYVDESRGGVKYEQDGSMSYLSNGTLSSLFSKL